MLGTPNGGSYSIPLMLLGRNTLMQWLHRLELTATAAQHLAIAAAWEISVTVCQDKAGTDESLQRAREWIQANASGTGVSAPTVSEGSVILQLS